MHFKWDVNIFFFSLVEVPEEFVKEFIFINMVEEHYYIFAFFIIEWSI